MDGAAVGAVTSASVLESAITLLQRGQNPDGGWGVEKGTQSNTEATSFAVMALAGVDGAAVARRVEQGVVWLLRRQRADGGWPLSEDLADGSWTTALAVSALVGFDAYRERAARGGQWLLRQEGRTLGWVASILYRVSPQSLATRLNPDLKGWSWTAGAFSWVEPTSYALIALKRLGLAHGAARARIREGERLLYDRMCEGGGWNYGNSQVLGVSLPPYPDTTAVALIALHDRRSEDANRLSLRALEKMLGEVHSGLALGWSILCFAMYGLDTRDWHRALIRSYEETGFLGLTKSLALGVLALTDRPGARESRAHA